MIFTTRNSLPDKFSVKFCKEEQSPYTNIYRDSQPQAVNRAASFKKLQNLKENTYNGVYFLENIFIFTNKRAITGVFLKNFTHFLQHNFSQKTFRRLRL